MPTTTLGGVESWGEATLASITAALALFFAAIPKVLGFIVILVLGWFIASLIASGVAALLRAVRFNDLASRSGFAGFVAKMGVKTDASGFIALTAKWFIRLIALVVAFDALGLSAVSDVLRQLLLWIPNLVVGIVVLVIGGLVADAFSNVVRGATDQAGFDNPALLGKISKIAVWAFAIVIAVNQIGIAETLVNTLVMATVGSVAIALGLAFGLGGRDVAAKIVADWYAQAGDNMDKVERLTDQTAAPPAKPTRPRTPRA